MAREIPTAKEIATEKQLREVKTVDIGLAERIQGLTGKQQKALALALSNPDLSEAEILRAAGYSVDKNSRANHMLKPLKGIIGDVLKECCGITHSDLAKAWAGALRATLKKTVTTKDKDGNEVTELVDVGPDHKLRADTAFKLARLTGYEKPIQVETKHEHIHKLEDESFEALKQRERRQIQLLDGDYDVIKEDANEHSSRFN